MAAFWNTISSLWQPELKAFCCPSYMHIQVLLSLSRNTQSRDRRASEWAVFWASVRKPLFLSRPWRKKRPSASAFWLTRSRSLFFSLFPSHALFYLQCKLCKLVDHGPGRPLSPLPVLLDIGLEGTKLIYQAWNGQALLASKFSNSRRAQKPYGTWKEMAQRWGAGFSRQVSWAD